MPSMIGYLFKESYHKWTKSNLPRNSSICEVMWYLKAHDGKRLKNDIYHNMKLPAAAPSWFQRLIKESHKITPELGYTIEYVGDGQYKVTAPQDASDDEANDEGRKEYILEKNQFSLCMKEKCSCFCEPCGEEGLCFHAYTCTCPNFTGRIAKAMFLIK